MSPREADCTAVRSEARPILGWDHRNAYIRSSVTGVPKSTPPPPSGPHPERILLIRPSALGDVCRTVPCLVSLRRAFPSARIDWLVQEGFEPAVAAHPDLSGVVSFPKAAIKAGLRRLRPGAMLAFGRSLRRAAYDAVYDLQGLARSGLMAALTRARHRVGFADARELGWLGYTRKHRVPDGHTVDRMLGLLEADGVPTFQDPHSPYSPQQLTQAMRLYTTPADRAWAESLGLGRVAVLAPTSRWPGKQWPADRFAVLARELLRSGRVDRVAIVGGKSERPACGPLLDGSTPGIVDLVGKTTIGGLMALIESSRLVVANDSAALHMAVGFDRPLVALFGPTRIDRVGPYKRDADVVQHITPADTLDHKNEAAGRALMERITADEVVRRALERLG